MRVQVTIPISVYKVLEKRCAPKSREDLMLKNGLIEEDGSAVKILIPVDRALTLIAWAREKAPESAGLITVKPDN